MFKKLLCSVCCFALCLSLAACTTGFDSLLYEEITGSDYPADNLVAENSKYSMQIDKNNMGIILTDKATGEVWSTTPADPDGPQFDEFGLPITKHPRVESILAVECKDFVRDEVNTYYSYIDAVTDGYITHEAIDNGIVINYHFAEAGIMIPLRCELLENGVKLSVDPTKIQESDNKVISLSIAPFFCGVKNDTKDSYLFVPSGSGALVGTETRDEQGLSYSAQVYGYDPAIDEVALVSTKENIRLNVFGSKVGNQAMCAIIDGSAASANVNVTAGSNLFGYSSVYATFIMRGYTNHIAELFSYEKVENVVYAKKMINKPVSVTFCPLSGDDANYGGMAEAYRNYLADTYNMLNTATDIPLSVRILGGYETKKSFLGIPYETVYPATTLKNAEKIMFEIKSKLGSNFAVQLKGFGDSGLDVGKIAGNYTVSDKLGSLKELKNLYAFADANNINLYFDVEMERFDTNSSGISKFFDSATNAGELKAMQYHYDMAVRDKNQDSAYNLLSPKAFSEVFGNFLKKTEKYDISGVSFDSMSSTAYSDYTDKETSDYYSKNGFETAADSVIKAAKESNKRFMASSANLYSAVMADIITEAPVTSDKSSVFLYDVPFYQMVFKGSIPLTVQSVNLAADPTFMVLKAVETGSGLGYTVIENWDSTVIDAKHPYFYNSVFEDVKGDMFANIEKLADYLALVSGKKITAHTVYDSGLRKTVFENGVSAYVNYSDKTQTTPVGEVAPYDYLVTEK